LPKAIEMYTTVSIPTSSACCLIFSSVSIASSAVWRMWFWRKVSETE